MADLDAAWAALSSAEEHATRWYASTQPAARTDAAHNAVGALDACMAALLTARVELLAELRAYRRERDARLDELLAERFGDDYDRDAAPAKPVLLHEGHPLGRRNGEE